MNDDLDLLQVARNLIEDQRKRLAQEEAPVMREGHRQHLAGLEAKSDDELRTWAARLIFSGVALARRYPDLDTPPDCTPLGPEGTA